MKGWLRACLHGGRVLRLTELPGKPSYPGKANFSYVSLENTSKRLHARQGNPPCRGILSTCPGHPSRRAIFCHVNGSSRLAEVRRGARTALYFKAAFNVNCLRWLRSISRVQNNSPWHWKAERMIKKKIPPKRFCCPPSCLLWLAAARLTISPRWDACKGRVCFNPPSLFTPQEAREGRPWLGLVTCLLQKN